MLRQLFEAAISRQSDRYLVAHSQPNSIRRQTEVHQKYITYVKEDSKVLDFGCKHAPDACLIRHSLGSEVSISGYDFERGDAFPDFYSYAGIDFTEANHPWLLPYEDELFDNVIASGVLEHVAMTTESLKEIYRVTKVGGSLIVTFLPNRRSYTEFLVRKSGSPFHHRRLYSRRLAKNLLLHHGFEPQAVGFHQFIPAQRGGKLSEVLWPLNAWLERVWPFRLLCANIYVIAVKRRAI